MDKRQAGHIKSAIGTIAHLKNNPAFQRMIEEVRAAPVATRLDVLLNVMNAGEMRRRGINLPEGSEVKLRATLQESLDNGTGTANELKVTITVCLELSIGIVSITDGCYSITIEVQQA